MDYAQALKKSETKSGDAQLALRDAGRRCREAADALRDIGFMSVAPLAASYDEAAKACDTADHDIRQQLLNWRPSLAGG